jgi:hypothetical protein
MPEALGPPCLSTNVSGVVAMLWKILGAAGAFIGVYVVRQFFGTVASIVAVAALPLAWWLLHLYTEKRLDGLYAQFQQLDDSQKAQALSELDPEIRNDIEKRIANEKTC